MDFFKARILDKNKYSLGEGPFYDPRFRRLSWVDISEGKVYFADYTEDKEGLTGSKDKNCYGVSLENQKSVNLGQMVGAAVPVCEKNGYLACGVDGLYFLEIPDDKTGEEENENITIIKKIYDTTSIYKSYHRSNDAKADSRGRLYLGSMVYEGEHEDRGNLYMLEKNGEGESEGFLVSIAKEKTKLSNGMAWNKDRDKFYFSDSIEHAVFSFDYDENTGVLSNQRKLFDIENGVPDGMCIDNNDDLWVCIWGGKRVEKRSSKTGEILGKIEVDAENVTCCCFAGVNFDKLIITTSGAEKKGDGDGCIFIADVGVGGPAPYYVRI